MSGSRTPLLSLTRALLTFVFYAGLVALAGASVVLAMGYPVGIDAGAPSGLKTGIVIPVSRVQIIQIILTLAGAALTLPVIWLLRAIVDRARSGDPFVPGNAARLRRIGWLVLMGDFLVTSSRSIALHHGITFPPIELSSLVMVLLIFVLARIFETGARMRTEIQETI